MRNFVGVDMETEKVRVTGHQMISDSYYVVRDNVVSIVDSLDVLPDSIKVFWYE